MRAPRIACIFVPLFPLAARLRSEPELAAQPVAVLEGSGGGARIVAATRPARKAGIRAGMTLAQARALLPGLIARGRDTLCEQAAQEALFDVAYGFSPRVENAGEGVVYADILGTSLGSRVSGLGSGLAAEDSRLATRDSGPSADRMLAEAMIAAAEKAGLPVRVGIAGSKLAARIAAELPGSPAVVPPGEDAAFLAALPLERFLASFGLETRDSGLGTRDLGPTLIRWGLKTVGDFARLPEGEVEARLGEPGLALHRAARGIDPRPLVPRPPSPVVREGMDLEWPLASLEPFLFVARAVLGRLCGRLASQDLACRRLEFELRLEPEGCDARSVEMPAPTREAKTLLALVRLDIEKRPPGAPVSGFAFTAHPDRPRRVELSLFGPAAISPDKLSTTLARMAALVGADRVGSPATVDNHLPERFAMAPYAPPPPPDLPPGLESRVPSPASENGRREPSVSNPRPETRDPRPAGGRGLLAVRVLRPPVPLEAVLGDDGPKSKVQSPKSGDGDSYPQFAICDLQSVIARPVYLTSLQTPVPNPQSPRIAGRVRVASGPWKMEEGWWSDAPADRDYWDVEVEGGGLYRIFRDNKTGEWFADGVYD